MTGPVPPEQMLDVLMGGTADADLFEALEESEGLVEGDRRPDLSAVLDVWEKIGEPLIKATLTLSDLPLEERLQRVREMAEWTGSLAQQMAESLGARWESVDDHVRWRCARLAAGMIGEIFKEDPAKSLASIGDVLIPALAESERSGAGLADQDAAGQLDVWAAMSPVVAAVQRDALGWEPNQLVRQVAERLDALVKPAAEAVGADAPKARVALLAAAAKFYSFCHYEEVDRQIELGSVGGLVPSDMACIWRPVEECLALLVETGLALRVSGGDSLP